MTTNNFTSELIATVMTILQMQYHQQIFIDIEDYIFIRKEITEQGSLYYPIVNENEYGKTSPILSLNENKLLSIIDVKKADKSIEKRLFKGLQAVEMRLSYRPESENNRSESESLPMQKPIVNRTKIEKKAELKRVNLLRYNGLEPFHDIYTDERYSLIYELEKLTYELIYNGSENMRIWAKENFKKAQKTAKNDIAGLVVIVEKTQKKRNQQLAAIKTNEIKHTRRKMSDKVKIFLTVALVGLGFLFALIKGFSGHKNTQKNTVKEDNNIVYLSSSVQVDSLIDVFETQHNIKIYTWRRGQITNNIHLPLPEDEIIAIIDSIANYNFNSHTQTTPKPRTSTQIQTQTTDDSGIGYNPNIQTTYTK